MNAGHVNPDNLLFSKNYVYQIENIVPQKIEDLNDLIESKSSKLFREHPFQNSPDFVKSLNQILESSEFKSIFNFN